MFDIRSTKSALDQMGMLGAAKAVHRFYRKCRSVHLGNRLMLKRVKQGNLLVDEAQFRAAVGAAIDRLLDRIGDGELGDYLEFGVYNGSTLSIVHDLLERRGRTSSRLFGFDSFEGLPGEANTDDNNIWMPGQFRCPKDFAHDFLTKRGVDWQRVTLIKGWFSETCTPATRTRYEMTNASIVMVDSDLYSSAVEALRFCEPMMRRHTLIIFDEYYPGGRKDRFLGEEKAFAEFLEVNPDIQSTALEDSYSFGSRMFLLERQSGR